MRREPVRHRAGLRDLVVVYDHLAPVLTTSRIANREGGEQSAPQRVGLAGSATGVNHAGAAVPGTGPIGLLLLARPPPFPLRARRPPGIPDLRSSMDVPLIGQEQDLASPQRFPDQADP